LSGGVGVTPMLSMLKTVVEVQPQRNVTFIHAAANSNVHALREEVETLAALDNVNSFFFYDSPTEEDRKNNTFDVEGYVTEEWLVNNIRTVEADFYFCGPLPFMKSINTALKNIGVAEERIHFEFFGPKGSLEESVKKEPFSV
jgi:nitric oxide dioxygenase